MFKQKNALISLAVAVVLAGCGGGGDDTPGTASSANNPATGGNNPGTIAPTSDAKLAGNLKLAGDLVLFTNANGIVPIAYSAFTSNTPRTDGTGYGAYGFEKGVNAPLQKVGYRVKFEPTTTGVAESKTGRVVFELQDQGTTAQEILQIMVDQVTMAESAAGVFSVTVAPAAKVYVYAKNSAGQEGSASATAPANVVKLSAPTSTGADPTASDLVLDVDAAVGAAVAAATGANKAVLSSAKDFTAGPSAPFEMALTLSNANMVLESNTATKLTGKAITVKNSGVAGVADGGGAKGYVQVQ